MEPDHDDLVCAARDFEARMLAERQRVRATLLCAELQIEQIAEFVLAGEIDYPFELVRQARNARLELDAIDRILQEGTDPYGDDHVLRQPA